jgi:GNAT superfamily N-acetyltransferase
MRKMPSFTISLASPTDIPALAHYEIERLFGNVPTPSGIAAATERHHHACKEHREETGLDSAVKCTTINPDTGKEDLAACAYWFIFPEPRTEEWMSRPNHLIAGSWLPEENGEREKAQAIMQPISSVRQKWLSQRPHAILMYMATAPEWRRQGAATAVVKWGLERCKELGIPAFLEASEDGRKVYEKLGFEVVDEVVMEMPSEGTARFPAMMWWPPGTEEGQKRPLI